MAEGALGVQLPPFVNPWYLFLDSKFVEVNYGARPAVCLPLQMQKQPHYPSHHPTRPPHPPGYQIVVALFFLISLPLNILFNAAATTTAAMVCVGRHQDDGGAKPSPSAAAAGSSSSSAAPAKPRKLGKPKPPPAAAAGEPTNSGTGVALSCSKASASYFDGGLDSPGRIGSATFRPPAALRSAAGLLNPPGTGPVALLKGGLAEGRKGWRVARPALKRVWMADLLFNAWSLPLQAASLLVLPVFWTFPRLLAIQLAVPAAILGGTGPKASLAASKELMLHHAAAYAWPYVALTLAARGVDAAKQALLMTVPERWWQEIIEVPIVVTIAFTVTKVLVMRMQDLLPLATYLKLTAPAEAAVAAAAAAARGGGGEAAAGGDEKTAV